MIILELLYWASELIPFLANSLFHASTLKCLLWIIFQRGFPCGSTGKESACNVWDLGSIPGLGRSPWERKGYPVVWPGKFHGLYSPWGHKESQLNDSHFLSFKGVSPGALVVKNPTANAGDIRDTSSTPWLGRFLGGGHGNPLQHSCLDNLMDRATWQTKIIRLQTARHSEVT